MRKILFIKLGAIGDVIQAAAAVLELKKQEPQTQVDWVVGASIYKLLQDLSFIDRLIPIPDQALYSGSYARRIYALIGGLFILMKNARSYDAVYIIAQAIEKAGSFDRTKVRDALFQVNYDGLVAKYDPAFEKTQERHDAILPKYYKLSAWHDGKLLPLSETPYK